jgi:hypothetical protein
VFPIGPYERVLTGRVVEGFILVLLPGNEDACFMIAYQRFAHGGSRLPNQSGLTGALRKSAEDERVLERITPENKQRLMVLAPTRWNSRWEPGTPTGTEQPANPPVVVGVNQGIRPDNCSGSD